MQHVPEDFPRNVYGNAQKPSVTRISH
uniref:Uncharacterized protein n=1 Tax=Arundo donax TaxID=35708 RepID=A0A0A9B6M6_ARUDO